LGMFPCSLQGTSIEDHILTEYVKDTISLCGYVDSSTHHHHHNPPLPCLNGYSVSIRFPCPLHCTNSQLCAFVARGMANGTFFLFLARTLVNSITDKCDRAPTTATTSTIMHIRYSHSCCGSCPSIFPCWLCGSAI
jgi:hypothetical protein